MMTLPLTPSPWEGVTTVRGLGPLHSYYSLPSWGGPAEAANG